MLNIHFGSCQGEVYNPPIYFKNQYEDAWITDSFTKEMIKDIDQSEVLGPHIIDSPVLGGISPDRLSGGVQTLILMAYDDTGRIFNASAGGDNCAKWILKIAQKKNLTITLHNIMSFRNLPIEAKILNSGRMIHNYDEYLMEAIEYL